MPLPPGPSLPVAVQTYLWGRRPLQLLRDCRRRYGDIFVMRIAFLGPVVVLADPEAVREIFAAPPDAVVAGKANRVLGPFLGQSSLFLLDGAPHGRHRRLMMPALHGERMEAYGQTMLDLAHASIDGWPVGRPFRLLREMQRLTLQIILRTVFGLEEGTRFTELSCLLEEILDIAARPVMLLPVMQRDLGAWSPWGRFTRAAARVDVLLLSEIRRCQEAPVAGRSDVLSMMCAARDEEERPLTAQELRDELMTLLVAGHETTATALCWAVRWLLDEPEVRRRLEAEIAAAVDGEGRLEPNRLGRLELLDATVRETLRLQPVVPMVARVLQRSMRLCGHDLPAGTMLAPSIYLMHRREAVYPDPERFVPDRFLGARPSSVDWMPFGGGARRCIGAAFALYEMKMVLAAVLSRTALRLSGAPPRVVRRAITLPPSRGLEVVLSGRRDPPGAARANPRTEPSG